MRSRQPSTTSLPSRLKEQTTNILLEGVDEAQDLMDLDSDSKPDLSAGVKKRKNEDHEDEIDINSDCSSPHRSLEKRWKEDISACVDSNEELSVDLSPSLRERPRKQRWINRESEPIYDWSKLPSGWSHLEPDLDDHDVDAQVERCKERIQDGYMPHIFEDRLQTLLVAQKQRQKTIAAYPAGLDFKVIQRLESLKRIKRHLEQKGDDYEELPNVEAIMEEYLSGTLTWVDGRVTYWSKGKKLGPSTIFDFDQFLRLNHEHQGHKGFWVEGVSGPRPSINAMHTVVIPSLGGATTSGQDYYDNHVHLTIRLAKYRPSPPPNPAPKGLAPPIDANLHPHADLAGTAVVSGAAWPAQFPEVELKFMDDTGSGAMHIWKNDLVAITPKPAPAWPVFEYYHPAVVGFFDVEDASGGSTIKLAIVVEVNMRAYDPRNMNTVRPYMKPKWDKILCTVDDQNEHDQGAPSVRLNGPWLRHVLYTASAPDNLHKLVVSTHKTGLTKVKTVDHTKAKPPRFPSPDREALYDIRTGIPEAGRPYEYRGIPLP